jgi:cystathionine beta-lyase/cystathionine gamma-synthase
MGSPESLVIPPGLIGTVRLSMRLEDPDNLAADITQALDSA